MAGVLKGLCEAKVILGPQIHLCAFNFNLSEI